MPAFQFSSRHVDLEFPGGIKCVLPLNEDVRIRIETAAKVMAEKSTAIISREGTEEDLEDLCDITLDAVDEILGEGMAAQIMEHKKDYSFFDCCDLFKFVTDEFNAAFISSVSSLTAKNGRPAPAAKPSPAPNRAQRRHHRRNR